MNITQFSIEEVRCFAERQNFEIRPLTFLVGENSTGKTTALGCFQALANYLIEKEVDFNRPPYTMGIFGDIVRNSKKTEKVFKLGFVYKYENQDVGWMVEFVVKKEGIQPAVNSLTLQFADGQIIFNLTDELYRDAQLIDFDVTRNQFRLDCGPGFLTELSLGVFLNFLNGPSEGKIALENYLKTRVSSVSSQYGPWDIWQTISVFSTAPIRSRPKRTYDPARVFDGPEGSDVPMQLMQIHTTQEVRWKALTHVLVEFGKRSGLFQDIEIKNLGQSLGAPFQLRVKVRGPNTNIVDVGYGVSQIVPILIQMLAPPDSRRPIYPAERRLLLFQQPEVHLHPRAQAELSSLMAKFAVQHQRTFIIETHSDYMIDRARIEIRKGTISPEDVSLIYLEPKGRVVKVHNIHFDEMANMIGVPKHYGEFFLKETDRLMGFAK